jgi:DMSO/TMAO reductase YedYZ molybdopterin-dependent catalytic subunit
MQRKSLPPGQREILEFPQFGKRMRELPDNLELRLTLRGDVQTAGDVGHGDLQRLPRIEQTSDMHCVTTWSHCGVQWGGVRFRDFYEQLLVPLTCPDPAVQLAIFYSLDGYRTSLPLEDALGDDVLLADALDGAPLPVEHGAPLRLVAPQHYGYKNVKHLKRIDVWRDDHKLRFALPKFMDHPRARVAYEERARGLPGWFYRYIYRPLIVPTAREFQKDIKIHYK